MSEAHPQHVAVYAHDGAVWLVADDRLAPDLEAQARASWMTWHRERQAEGLPCRAERRRRRPADAPVNESAFAEALRAQEARRAALLAKRRPGPRKAIA